ncbi:carboxypeptidase-like regulatory domain-containing protein [Geoalkalibacter sp.]|uniref:carboxypeptidase-like regulatory domain-containing protein n=1 Tax=Geoalkalibacter sp. TaxID=3041440 RepID=UPI00272E00CE|nr:carboxypeptidase-like regulatory domain-containing protein [Geoalkalibacter sp.]
MNPVLLSLLLFLLWISPLAAQSPEMGRVTGQLKHEGVDTYQGVASLWDVATGKVPDPRRYIVIPSATAVLEADGRFELRAPPGTYYLGAVLRQTPGPPVGPPRPGDLVFMSPDAAGGHLKIEVRAEETTDVGVRTGGWEYAGFSGETELAIEGRVRDLAGEPVAGLLVFAFADPGMSQQPVGVSERTDAQGRYLLRLGRAQTVYLRARESYGGGPLSGGGYVGVYGGAEPRVVEVPEKGRISGIDIEVLKLPPAGTDERRPMRPEQPPEGMGKE